MRRLRRFSAGPLGGGQQGRGAAAPRAARRRIGDERTTGRGRPAAAGLGVDKRAVAAACLAIGSWQATQWWLLDCSARMRHEWSWNGSCQLPSHSAVPPSSVGAIPCCTRVAACKPPSTSLQALRRISVQGLSQALASATACRSSHSDSSAWQA